MTPHAPTRNGFAAGFAKHKLGMFLSAAIFAWGVTNPAAAAITNTATATANGGAVIATANESVDVVNQTATMTIDKQATVNDGGDGIANVGDTITYTFDVKNTGTVTLQNVTIADTLAIPSGEFLFADDVPPFTSIDAGINASWDFLAPGETVQMTATYVLTAADILASTVTNTATANSTTLGGTPVSATDTEITNLSFNSALSLDKIATLQDGGDGVQAGDTIDYTFNVTNSGTVPLTNVFVDDPLVNMASLPGHEQMMALFDVAKSGVDPIATASLGLAPVFETERPIGAAVVMVNAVIVQPDRDIPQLPVALTVLRKMVLMSGDAAQLKAGDEVGIYFDLFNTGEGPLTNIVVTQANAEAYGGSLDILAPNSRDNASIIFTRTLSAEDINSGVLMDMASVSYNARGRSFTTEIVDVLPLGDLANVTELATATILPASVASLAAGDTATFTATHILTQADVDAGVVNNTAVATGTDPLGDDKTSTDSTSTTLPPAAALAVLKEGTVDLGLDGELTVGDVVNFTFSVRNTGNVTLTGITLADPLPGIVLSGGPIASLAPNIVDTTTFTATYAITQADVDAEEVRNQAEATGTLPDNTTTITDLSHPTDETLDDETVVVLTVTKDISVLKTVASLPTLPFTDSNGNGLPDAGEFMNYTMTVTNTGNVTLNNVNVVDQNPLVIVTPAPPTGLTLLPAASTVFTGLYELTQADIDAGFILNTADANGLDPDGANVADPSHPTDPDADGATRVDLAQVPGIALIKRQSGFNDLNANSVIDLGDEINYEFDVTNTGNVTLTNIVITDANADSISGALPTLLPGVTITNAFTAMHTVDAADMLAGEVVNSATATADTPGGGTTDDLSDPSDPTEDDATITAITVQPAIAVQKIAVGIADTNTNSAVDAGDTVSFRFEVMNTGNVELSNVTIADLVGGVTMVGLPIPLLDAGDTDTTTFTATYILQPGDIAAGEFRNRAQASGTAPDTTVVTDQSDDNSFTEDGDTIIAIGSQPAVALVKRFDRIEDVNNNSVNDAGDEIHYRFDVSNVGNTNVHNIEVQDANATVSGGPLLILAIGATDTTTFTAIHVLTQADINAGTFENQATITAEGPPPTIGLPVELTDDSDESDVTGNDPTFTSLLQGPKIAVVKTIKSITDKNGNGFTDIGDVINYAFAVHNTGNVTLTNVSITDPNAVMQGGPIATLQPGAINSTTFTAKHVITNADAEAEQVVNQATATGLSPLGGVVSDLSDDSSPSGGDPTIVKVAAPKPVLTKVAAKSEVRRGERLSYTITASNLRTGPYDITDIMPPGFDYVGGSASVNGSAKTPVEVGNVLTFTNIAPNADGRVVIKLQLLSSATVATGKFINRAQLIFSPTGDILTTAQAIAMIKDEHVFDCGEIIGRVFDDKNANGYQDKGELGLAGVRLATVNGLLITTDKNGLYHISCADIPNAQIGSNFLLKLDTRTLPVGYQITTENPRDVRLTRGKITKLNFGASKNTDIELELKRDAFSSGISLYPQWADGLDRLVALLEEGRGSLSIVYRCGQYAPIADARVAAVRQTVERRWADAGHNQRLKITTRVECGK